MRLGLHYHINGQVVEVRHIDEGDSVRPQQLRDNKDTFALTER